ncbi:hypothetical protein Tco_1090042 [Tanacetum coccineum]|uniref:Reverse transcriptase domain-containing protein n=1 Tax=Tanacetum coccineum TaxID=301880 RepID=A0ABQ5I336_9ASTR
MEQMTSICAMIGQIMQKKEEEKQIAEEQAAKDRYWKIPIRYDDDEDFAIAITPVLSTKEPVDSLIMENEHLDTILATESDELIKSSVENLVPIPSEFEGISEDTCDVPVCIGLTPKVILIAWESFGKIKDALMDKQYRQEDIQELMSKLLEDVRNISEEFSEYINCPSWNRPLFYFDDDDDEYTVIWRRPKVITPDEPSEEPEDPLIMGEKELSTIPEKDKSSVEDLVQIPSGSKGVSDDICDNDHSDAESLLSQDIPITSPKIDFLSEEFTGEFAPIPPGMDEDEFDEEEVDCYDHDISKTRSGSSTTNANNSLPEYDSFLFEVEPYQDGLTSIVISDNNPLLELPEFESFHFDLDPSFPRPPSEPPDVEISLIIETDAPVIKHI